MLARDEDDVTGDRSSAGSPPSHCEGSSCDEEQYACRFNERGLQVGRDPTREAWQHDASDVGRGIVRMPVLRSARTNGAGRRGVEG